MNAEGDAVMMKLNLGPVADTIWNVAEQALKLKCDLTVAMQFVRTRSAHQTEYTMLASRTALNASHFEDGKLPRIECHAGIIGASVDPPLI